MLSAARARVEHAAAESILATLRSARGTGELRKMMLEAEAHEGRVCGTNRI